MGIVGAELWKRVEEYLDSQNWEYSAEKEIQLDFGLDNQLEECNMIIRFISYGEGRFSVHTRTVCPLSVPIEKKDSISEFITKVNYGMMDGYFSYRLLESNSAIGTLEYNCRLYCGDVLPSLDDVESSVYFPLHMMKKYGDAIFNILKHDASPEEQIQRVEG